MLIITAKSNASVWVVAKGNLCRISDVLRDPALLRLLYLVLLTTFSFNLSQVMSPSIWLYPLILARGHKPLNPLISPCWWHSPPRLRPSKALERKTKKRRGTYFGSLIWFAYMLLLRGCVWLCAGQTLTAHHNHFIPILRHAWLHHLSNSPWEPLQNLRR